MLTPKGRGDLSEALFQAMRVQPDSWDQVINRTPTDAEDAHISLWAMYELHYRGFEDVCDELEWHPALLTLRARLEHDFEKQLRRQHLRPALDQPFAESFFEYVARHDGRSLAAFVQREADTEQVLTILRHRSIYHLKESDPTAWVVPRLPVGPKAALMELQFDEYGCGNPNRLHAQLFAQGLEACGLRSEYGAYIDDVSLEILEQNNAMSLFGLHRRLRGAALGHLAAFEATSSLPSRRMVQGLTRLGLPKVMIDYYDEHVEADAVHEQLAVRTICGALIEQEPELLDDVIFGASVCLDLEDKTANRLLEDWNA